MKKVILIFLLSILCLVGKKRPLSALSPDPMTIGLATGITAGGAYGFIKLYQKLNNYFDSNDFAETKECVIAKFAALYVQEIWDSRTQSTEPSRFSQNIKNIKNFYSACDNSISRMGLIASNYFLRPDDWQARPVAQAGYTGVKTKAQKFTDTCKDIYASVKARIS